VAAGYYDAFFETGLSPWDVAAGSLMITEAGGLVGNFTGEADFLYQREVVAGTPRVYGQLVQLLAPYTRVIADTSTEASDPPEPVATPPQDATEAFVEAAAPAPAAPARKPAVRIRKPAASRPDDAPF
jgi:myo-inositol-1(or 4)-monophosphatase